MFDLYAYKATVLEVYDGDTLRLKIDLGFGIVLENESVRLFGINTPELRGEEREDGLVSRDRLRDLILGKDVTLITVRDSKGKYGRYLGTIYIDDADGNLIDINQQLIVEGLAVPYMV
jgi:micrococcal nuclease